MKDSAKVMYDKLEAAVIQQLSGSSAFGTQLKIMDKQFTDVLTMENFEKHLTFYHSKNTILNSVNAGIDNTFLAFILLCLFQSSATLFG